MRKRVIYITAAAAALGMAAGIAAAADKSEAERCRGLAESFGWQLSEAYTETEKIRIPDPFDEVYKSYNVMQKEAGFDLEPYCGKSGMRYTFAVENYPVDVGEPVYANVLCIDGKPVGGDIMTVSISGFMHSLKMPD